jgi:hypothetical protein
LDTNTNILGGGADYRWGKGPRIFNKSDYGRGNLAKLETADIAPSTSTGASLRVYETPDSTDHRSTWWVWYDGEPLSKKKITNEKTDRMSFYLKLEGTTPIVNPGRMDVIIDNVHVGTYLCWNDDRDVHGQGDGCPYEGPGNQHYYHYLALNPDAWIHVLLDQHPQHRRGQKASPINNPSYVEAGKNYFAQLHRFYIETRNKSPQKTSYLIDELNFYSTNNTPEPSQNEVSINSLWVGYWPNLGYWEIGFQDSSYAGYSDNTNGTYEIRWSTDPITNSNFSEANTIEPMYYGGEEYVGAVNNFSKIRRHNSWKSQAWTRFKLPSSIQNSNVVVYFAVKDVSIKGENQGTRWPWTKADGQDAPTSFIKTINYHIN